MIGRARLAGPFVVRALRACDREIAAALPRVLRSADEEAVHDLRVGIRRMRVLLKLARPVLGRHYADSVRAAYTVVHQSTGELRDAEVLDDTLGALDIADGAFASWVATRRKREASLRRAVVRSLEAGDLSVASNLLHALILLPLDPSRDRPLVKFGKQSVVGAYDRMRKRDGVSTENVAGLHALRIAYKSLRYAAEILSVALPEALAACAAPAAKFQKRLGEIHDVDVAIEVVRRARSLPAHTKTRSLALLAEGRLRTVAKYLAEPKLEMSTKTATRSDSTESADLATNKPHAQFSPP